MTHWSCVNKTKQNQAISLPWKRFKNAHVICFRNFPLCYPNPVPGNGVSEQRRHIGPGAIKGQICINKDPWIVFAFLRCIWKNVVSKIHRGIFHCSEHNWLTVYSLKKLKSTPIYLAISTNRSSLRRDAYKVWHYMMYAHISHPIWFRQVHNGLKTILTCIRRYWR